jgi:hypothetical protein
VSLLLQFRNLAAQFIDCGRVEHLVIVGRRKFSAQIVVVGLLGVKRISAQDRNG